MNTNSVFHINNNDAGIVPLSSAMTREYQVAASSFSLNSASFQVDLAPEQILDREVMVWLDEIRFRVTSGANNVDVNYESLRNFVYRAFPVNSCLKNLNVQLNNSSISVEPQLWINALNQFNSDEYLESLPTPCFPNTSSNFVNMVSAQNQDPKSPCNGKSKWSRSSLPIKIRQITAKGAGNPQIIEVKVGPIIEPLYHPFFNQSLHAEGLKQIKSLRVDMTFNSGFPLPLLEGSADVLIKDTAGNACTISTAPKFGSIDPETTFSTSTMKLLLRSYIPPVKIPPVVSHNYREFIVKPLTCSMTNSSTTTVSNSITLPAPPAQLMFFCRSLSDHSTYTTTDALAGITAFTLNTPKNTGLLSGASQAQLHDISVRNGLNQSYPEFSQWRGSCLMLDLGKGDIPGYIPNSLGQQFAFDYSITTNPYTTVPGVASSTAGTGLIVDANGVPSGTCATLTWTIYCIAIYDRKFTCDGSSCYLSGGYSPESLQKALGSMEKLDVSMDDRGSGIMSGGSFRSFLRGLKRPLGAVLKVGSALVPNPAAKVAMQAVGSALGAGHVGQGNLLRG
jgi:hypothetical protein